MCTIVPAFGKNVYNQNSLVKRHGVLVEMAYVLNAIGKRTNRRRLGFAKTGYI